MSVAAVCPVASVGSPSNCNTVGPLSESENTGVLYSSGVKRRFGSTLLRSANGCVELGKENASYLPYPTLRFLHLLRIQRLLFFLSSTFFTSCHPAVLPPLSPLRPLRPPLPHYPLPHYLLPFSILLIFFLLFFLLLLILLIPVLFFFLLNPGPDNGLS